MTDFKEIRKHFGSFSLDARDMALYPDFWGRILSNVLVTRCEHQFQMDVFVYNGFSLLFRPIEEGTCPLFYKFDIDGFNDIVAIETEELKITRVERKEHG